VIYSLSCRHARISEIKKKIGELYGHRLILFPVPPLTAIHLTKHDIPDLRCNDAVSWSYEKSLNPFLAFLLNGATGIIQGNS